jgi:hypothetical protein
MTRIDALTDAFAKMLGWHDPKSRAYELRNPIMLRAFTPKHAKTEDGYRVFHSFSSGYDNARIDISIKCSGKSRSKLTPEDTLENLVQCYGYPKTSATYIKKFLRHALKDDNIMEKTPLGWFLEDVHISDIQPENE